MRLRHKLQTPPIGPYCTERVLKTNIKTAQFNHASRRNISYHQAPHDIQISNMIQTLAALYSFFDHGTGSIFECDLDFLSRVTQHVTTLPKKSIYQKNQETSWVSVWIKTVNDG